MQSRGSNSRKISGVLFSTLVLFFTGCKHLEMRMEEYRKKVEQEERIKKEVEEKEREREEKRKEIKALERNEDYLCERREGVVEKEADKQKIINDLIKEARGELARMIEVRVVAVVVDELKSDKRNVEERFYSEITTYTDKILSQQIKREYSDFPRDRMVTVILCISKTKQDELVKKDLENRVSTVTTPLMLGLNALRNRNPLLAMRHFIEAFNKWRRNLGIFVRRDVDGDGNEEEVSSFIEAKIREIVGGIHIDRVDTNPVMFDTSGNMMGKPAVIVRYGEENIPVPNFPLCIQTPKMEIKGGYSTSADGRAVLALPPVDPSEQTVSFVVMPCFEEIQREKYQGLINTLTIEAVRTKAIAYAVYGRGINTRDIEQRVSEKLREIGYGALRLDAGNGNVDNLIQSAYEGHVDYLVYITLRAGAQEDQFGMWSANIYSEIQVYRIPQGQIVCNESASSSSQDSLSRSSAIGSAYSRIQSGIFQKIESCMREVFNR